MDYSAASFYYLSNSMLVGNVFTENSAWPTAGSTSAAATARGAAVALLDSTLWMEGETYENNSPLETGERSTKPPASLRSTAPNSSATKPPPMAGPFLSRPAVPS